MTDEPEITAGSEPEQSENDYFEKYGTDADGETPEGDTPEGDQQAETEEATPAPFEVKDDKLVFDGQEMTAEEIRASLLRQADYTRKTQELSVERKALEAERETLDGARIVYEAVGQLPDEEQRRILAVANEAIAKARGYDTGVASFANGKPAPATQQAETPTGATPFADKLKGMNFDEDFVGVVAEMERSHFTELAAIKRQFGEVSQEFRGYLAEQRGDVEAQGLAETFKAKGIDVTPADLRKAQKETGIQDMEAAYLKQNFAKLMESKGTPAPDKPGTPPPRGNTFQIGPNTTEEEIFQAAQAGQVAIPYKEPKKPR